MNRITIITGNQSKLDEYNKYLSESNSDVKLSRVDVDIPEIQSLNHKDILYNKIEVVAKMVEGPFVIDDVCFYTEKYENFPGPYAKFVNNTLGLAGWKKLFEDGDAISAVATLGLCAENSINFFEGKIDGIISFKNTDKINPHAPINNIFFIPGENDFLGNLIQKEGFRNHRRIAFENLLRTIFPGRTK